MNTVFFFWLELPSDIRLFMFHRCFDEPRAGVENDGEAGVTSTAG